MSLSIIAQQTKADQQVNSKGRWELRGHDAEVLNAAARLDVFATCDLDGITLLWRVGAESTEHVCKVATGGPAVLDLLFISATTLAAAQGDGHVSLWDVECGRKYCVMTRSAARGRSSWPVINTLTAVDEELFMYGGDDGYLVHCDSRKSSISGAWNLRRPITASACFRDSLLVGDACGSVHWCDLRMFGKRVAELKCSEGAINSMAHSAQEERFVAYGMDGVTTLVDVQPFALTNDDRFLGKLSVGADENRCTLLRCDWSKTHSAIVLPTASGVACVGSHQFSGGVLRSIESSSVSGPLNFSKFVDDRFLVFGGSNGVLLHEW